mgnify:CR=1 FL=1
MSHCLVIGGTGMLKDVSRKLGYYYDTVSVIGRNKHRMYALSREMEHLNGNLYPLLVDYTDYEKLSYQLKNSIERYGDIDLVVSWIHSTAGEAGRLIAEKINTAGEEFRFFDVLGSSYADPSKKDSLPEFVSLDNIKYRRVVLGFIIENNNSRWLTDEEISSGVMDAIKNDREYSIIGTTEPWDKRP